MANVKTAISLQESLFEQVASQEDLQAIAHALKTGADNAEGFAIPRFVAATWATLPCEVEGISMPNYFEPLLAQRIPGILPSLSRAFSWSC